MIFFYNAQGNVMNVVPEPVYQGSNKANTIYVVAPFPSNVQVLAYFLLPNGEILQPAYAPNKNGLTLLDTLNINDSSVGVWGVPLTKVMTAYAGTVSVQFEFISYDQEITTKTVTFPVSKGVPPSVPLDTTAETTLQEILSYISVILETLDTVSRETPLVSNETFVLDVTHESIVVGYNASIPLSSFNKTPVQGDKFWGICKTNDNYAYSFVATVTSVDNENSVVEVEFTKVVLLYDANIYVYVLNKIPLVVDETLLLPVTHDKIYVGYANSIDINSLNKTPTKGETFFGLCKTTDGYVYSFLAKITETDYTDGFANFEFIEVTLLHNANIDKEVANKLNKIVIDGNGDKFLADDGEYKKIDVGSANYTEGLSFTVTSEEEKTCEVSNGTANSEEIIIPPYVFINSVKYAVTSIRYAGFFQKTIIKTVAIPETVTKIGIQAFDGCTNLVNVKIPSSVVELGSIVFQKCHSLEEIEIPDSVTSITPYKGGPQRLFESCNNLKKVVLGKGLTNIPFRCFAECINLTDIIIKGEIEDVYTQAFNGVENATIWVNNDLVDYYKNLLKIYTSLPIRPYRDLIGVNKIINDNRLYQHQITLNYWAYIDDEIGLVKVDDWELYPTMTRSTPINTTEELASELQDVLISGYYIGEEWKVRIDNNNHLIGVYRATNTDGQTNYDFGDITENNRTQGQESYWTISDRPIKIGE